VLPILGFEPPDSPRTRGTVDAIRRHLGAGGPLLYRYPPGRDGLAGSEGAFLPCSFWLVQALAATDRADEAGELLTELIGLGEPLGLYAEEMDPGTRHHLGNFPQALTHAALVQASLAVRDARFRQLSGQTANMLPPHRKVGESTEPRGTGIQPDLD
jgi:GH15 family glucan-1,4-alpha-glucosidase